MNTTAKLFMLAYRLAPYFLNQNKVQEQKPGITLTDKDIALVELRQKDGAVILIIGRRESGKTILSQRIAEFLGRPTFAISPNQHPPEGITEIKLEDIDNVPPGSTLILDDIPLYLSSKDYSEALARNVERLIPVTRHKKIMLIFISQTSSFADKWCMDADAIFLKQGSLLFEDLERPAVKKLYQMAQPYFDGKDDNWRKRHVFLVTDSFRGILEVKKAD